MDALYGLVRQPGEVCVKMPYRGFEISLVLDDSHTGGTTLMRTYLRIFLADSDVTDHFFGLDEVIAVTGAELRDAFYKIDTYYAERAPK